MDSETRIRKVAEAVYKTLDPQKAMKICNLSQKELNAVLRNPRYSKMFRTLVDGGMEYTCDHVLQRLATNAFDIDMADFDGIITGIETLEEARARGVPTWVIKKYLCKRGNISLELNDSVRALGALGKLLQVGKGDSDDEERRRIREGMKRSRKGIINAK